MTRPQRGEDRVGRSGSNFPSEKNLLESEKRAIETRGRAYRKAGGAFRLERKRVLTPRVAETLTPLLEGERMKYARASLAANGDADAIRKAGKRARNAIDKALPNAVPGYKRYVSTRKAYFGQRRTLLDRERAAILRDGTVAEIGDFGVSDEMNFRRFAPPYPLYRVSTIDFDNLVTYNGSFADHQNGILFNSIRFKHVNNAGWLAYNPGLFVQSNVAAGLAYEMPSSGRLKGNVAMRSLYNHYAMSLADNFGISDGSVFLRQNIFVEVYFGDHVRSFRQLLVDNGLEALGGTDLDFADSPVQTFSPITLNFTVNDFLTGGTRVHVLFGSNIYIYSELNDMDSHVVAEMTWQIPEISMGVVA